MAVHEALTCGNTEIQVHNLRIVTQELSAVDKRHRMSGYALEFQVRTMVVKTDTFYYQKRFLKRPQIIVILAFRDC
jgi:hypothetical protein